MAHGRFVAYLRVSTQRQGQSGLGLEAQKEAVTRFLDGGKWQLLGEYVEVETGKGADALARRPQLKAALELCKKQRATLIIAKLDRLARNVHFVTGLMETGIDFKAADMPHADKVMIQMYSIMAEWERDQISKRTKDALAAAKARGVVLGKAGPVNLRPNIEQRQRAADEFAHGLAHLFASFKASGFTQRQMVDELNRLGIRTARGKTVWQPTQVAHVLKRLQGKHAEA
jgi:DNA invertase Pin-like site-specific DNA recombinase